MPLADRTRAGSIDSDATANHAVEGGATPTSALLAKQLIVEECEFSVAVTYNRLWHSVLPEFRGVFRGLKACFAGRYGGEIRAVAIWTSPISRGVDDGTTSELRRFAIGPGTPANTASRMLTVMVKLMGKKYAQLVKVISYQATSVHSGTIYKAAGWSYGRLNKAKDCRWLLRKDGKRNPLQIESDKIRWEKVIRPPAPCRPPSPERLR